MNAPGREVPESHESVGNRLTRMEERLTRMEERMATMQEHGATKADIRVLEARVASIEKHGATKADLKALEARIGWWVLGVTVMLVVQLALLILRT